jgi:hypothetical protein
VSPRARGANFLPKYHRFRLTPLAARGMQPICCLLLLRALRLTVSSFLTSSQRKPGRDAYRITIRSPLWPNNSATGAETDASHHQKSCHVKSSMPGLLERRVKRVLHVEHRLTCVSGVAGLHEDVRGVEVDIVLPV